MSRMEYRVSRIDLALYSTLPCDCFWKGKGGTPQFQEGEFVVKKKGEGGEGTRINSRHWVSK